MFLSTRPRLNLRRTMMVRVLMFLLVMTATPLSARAAVDAPPAAETSLPDDSLNMSYTFMGTFISYAPDRQEITVTDENGEELILTVDAEVVPTRDGRTVTFADLHPADRLNLTVLDDENGSERITAIDMVRAPATTTR